MNQYFCLYCEVHSNGMHRKTCLLYKAQQERKEADILDRYEDIIHRVRKVAEDGEEEEEL